MDWTLGFTGNDGTGTDGTRNDGHGGRSDIFWERSNRLNDKVDGSIKDHGTFKVDVIKSIGEIGNERKKSTKDGYAGVHKEFATCKSDHKAMKWQLRVLFSRTLCLVLWSLMDYIQLSFPAFWASEEGTPHTHPEPPEKKLQK
ncbi:hypothetical protein HOY80DRAFT_1134581 [Tuber brumale]|nr:hypothetical protein HOY80DRAFT_1134581 [Tuber brumale]